MKLYKQRRRPYEHIIPKHEILKVEENITADGGAYVVAFKLNDLRNNLDGKQFNDFYAKLIQDSFDAIDRIIKEKHCIDFDYVNIAKVLDKDGEEIIALYVTAKELGVEMIEDGQKTVN